MVVQTERIKKVRKINITSKHRGMIYIAQQWIILSCPHHCVNVQKSEVLSTVMHPWTQRNNICAVLRELFLNWKLWWSAVIIGAGEWQLSKFSISRVNCSKRLNGLSYYIVLLVFFSSGIVVSNVFISTCARTASSPVAVVGATSWLIRCRSTAQM